MLQLKLQGTDQQEEKKTVDNMVQDPIVQQNQVPLYNSVDNDFIFNGNHDILIDIRTLDKYKQCHIYKAIHIAIDVSYLDKNLTNWTELNCSHPDDIKNIFGSSHQKIIVLYAPSNINTQLFDYIFILFNKHPNSIKFKYYVLTQTFEEFQLEYPFYCVSINNNPSSFVTQISGGYPNVILKNELFLGNGTQATNYNVIYNLKITHILNVTRLIPNVFMNINNMNHLKDQMLPSIYQYFQQNPVKYFKLKLIDVDDEKIDPYFDKTFKFIDDALNCNNGNNNNKILIHCQAGISRSSTICIGYLMYHKKWTLVDSYQHVKARRVIISPNNGFLKQLMLYEEKLFGKNTMKEIEERGVRNLKFFWNYMNGKKVKKRRNFAKMLTKSMDEFLSKQQNK